MKVFSFLLLFLSSSFACHLNSKFQYISLSGPVTMLLQEMNLLNDPSLKAISKFHTISSNKFKRERLAGGLFLSPKVFQNYSEPIVFFDESLELRRTMNSLEVKKLEIQTRNINQWQIHEKVVTELKPYLRACEKNMKEISQSLNKIKTKIQNEEKFKSTFFFYLGELQNRTKPQLVITNDLFVKTLKTNKKLETYPSQMDYVTWSQKISKKFENVIEIGISEGLDYNLIKIADKKFNITGPGSLTPGISQLYFIDKLLSYLKQLDKKE